MGLIKKLLEPGSIGPLSIKNRLIMAPMTDGSCDEEGYVTDSTINYYVERAKGGIGLIIVQFASVMANARGGLRLAALYDDKFIPRLRDLTNAVKKYDTRIAVQLAHAGSPSRAQRQAGFKEGEQVIVAPSAVANLLSGVVPRELTLGEIQELVEAFAQAAWRAREAGFDAVEIQGAHGRLINQFLSPYYNRRSDQYGGSLENRARFGCEILAATRRKVGSGFPVIIRMNGRDAFEGGLELAEAVKVAKMYEAAGAQALDVSAGGDEARNWLFLTYMQQSGGLVYLADAIKKAVNVPVIVVGKLGDPMLAEKVLQEGKADFIAMGRPLIADPYLPLKVKEGRLQDICQCIYCGNCNARFSIGVSKFKRLPCITNPELARGEFRNQPAPRIKSVMVIGGGPAGMEAARVAAGRGHKVTLYEKNSELGGQWNIVCQQEHKEQFATFTERLKQGLIKAGVTVILNQAVTPDLVKEKRPDAIILAAGAVPAKLNVRGAEGKNVVQATDVICGNAKVGDRVVVVGGRYVGIELAVFLAQQHKKVSLVTRSRLGRDIATHNMAELRDLLIEHGVYVYPDSVVVEISDKGVLSVNFGSLFFLKADTVVLASGFKPEKELLDKLSPLVPEIYAVGDCVEPQDALEAVSQGADAGYRI